MNSYNIQQLQHKARTQKVSPPATAWNKLESKLESAKSQKKVNFVKYISIAAIMLVLLAVISVFNIETRQNDKFTNKFDNYQDQLSELNVIDNDGIYDVTKLQELRIAYRKMGDKKTRQL